MLICPKFYGLSIKKRFSCFYHTPVMLEECCNFLNVERDKVYVDCTIGGGGHTKKILELGGRVIGIDHDPEAISHSKKMLSNYISSNQLDILHTNFRFINEAIKNSNLWPQNYSDDQRIADGVLMDLGVSSHQINESQRGFSFSNNGILDMRMNNEQLNKELNALSILNEWDVDSIANILYQFGDEGKSKQIAREIVFSRPLSTTFDLVQAISRITPQKNLTKTLAKCFQAIRIKINDELGALEYALTRVHDSLRLNGRLVVISYHSLEDKRVKNMIKFGSLDKELCLSNPWCDLTKKAVVPSTSEITANRRARSAKMRVAVRIH